MTMEHEVSGTLSVKSDCTLEIPDFTYDGKAPSVYVWGGKECTPGAIARGGRLSNTEIPEKRYSNKKLSIPLKDSLDFENIGCISIYCEQFSADLGHVQTKFDTSSVVAKPEPTPPTPKPNPKPEPTPSKPQEENVPSSFDGLYGLQNCQVLRKDYLNLHWTLEGNTVKMALEGRPGGEDKWMAFGYSPVDSFGSIMVGSNVVVAGYTNGGCFAYDYFLSDYEQCDFLSGNGVCPQVYSNGSSNADLTIPDLAIECTRNGSYMSVYFERPLTVGGATWPTDGSSSAVFAMGPVSPESNADMPVVLYHALVLPGSESAVPVPFNSPKGERLLVALDQEQNTCKSLQGLSDEVGAIADSVKVPVISDTGVFEVTSGDYTVHPDPPGWGLAYIVNGVSLPVLNVVRGKTYTFKVMAGPTHPLYLTSSSVGAGVLTDYANEIVYGGNDTTFGTEDEPYFLMWTPNDTTPDILYYQCDIHQKLGWQIHVFDTEEDATRDAEAMNNEEVASIPIEGSSPESGTEVLTDIEVGGSCRIDINGTEEYFQQCDTIAEIPGFVYAWNISEFEEDTSSTKLIMAMRAPLTAGQYVSLGFPQQRDIMIGSSALVMAQNREEVTLLLPYYLGAQNQNGVKQSSQGIDLLESAAFRDDSGSVSMFTVRLPISFSNGGSKRRLSQASTSLEDFNFLWSSGSTLSDGEPAYHGVNKGSLYVNLQNGIAETTVNTQTLNLSARRAHMWLMAIGWGLFIPLGIVGARMKETLLDKKSAWFQVHRAVQTLGYSMGLAGIGCGFAVRGEWYTPFTVHRDLGVTITVLGAVQIISLVARPSPDSTSRVYWGYWHRWMGRAASILAVANIYYGMFDVADVDTWAWVVYTVLLAVIVAIGVLNDGYRVFSNKTIETGSSEEDIQKSNLSKV